MESRSSSQANARKPPTKKFSIDSFRPGHSQRSSSESAASVSTEHKQNKGSSKFTPLKEVREERKVPKDDASIEDSGSSRVDDRQGDSDSVPPLPTNSSVRWNSIRQHVLPPNDSSAGDSQQSHQPSPSASSWNFVPSRSQTPKPSRLARLGFRQVVDQAREVVEDDTRKFEIEIRRACWIVRGLPEFFTPAKPNIHGTVASTLHLPFMPNTSMSSINSSNATPGPQSTKKSDQRRPLSIHQLMDKGNHVGSVASLHQVLFFYAGMMTGGGSHMVLRLPSESLVLSTLCYPFLIYGKPGMEEEKGLALQAFDLILRTWNPTDEVLSFIVLSINTR